MEKPEETKVEEKLNEIGVEAQLTPPLEEAVKAEPVVPERQEVLKVFLERNMFSYETNLDESALKILLRDIIDELTLREFEARMIRRAKAVAQLQKQKGPKLWTPGDKL